MFQFRGLEALFGEAKPTVAPSMATGLLQRRINCFA